MNNELYKCFLKHGYNCKNIKPQEEFKLECNRFSLIAKKHLLNCQKTYSALISNIKRKEYSTGGELLPRGFYCPSPIYDIVTGNCNRGKLLKRITSRSKPTYEYCFNNDNKLIIVNHLYKKCSEFLEYADNIVVGITFSRGENVEIISVIECLYDTNGRIVSYTVANSSFNDCHMDQLYKELYLYNQKGLYKAEIFDYLDDNQGGIVNHDIYSFKHDDGYLNEYKVETSYFKNDVYKISVKRRL